jgi:hypothetical protein
MRRAKSLAVSHTAVTLLSHCCCTALILLPHCCNTDITLFLLHPPQCSFMPSTIRCVLCLILDALYSLFSFDSRITTFCSDMPHRVVFVVHCALVSLLSPFALYRQSVTRAQKKEQGPNVTEEESPESSATLSPAKARSIEERERRPSLR